MLLVLACPMLACLVLEMRQLEDLHLTWLRHAQAMHDFTGRCLDKNPGARLSPGELLQHPFLERARDNVYLAHRLLGAAPQQQLRATRRSSDSVAASDVRNSTTCWLPACCAAGRPVHGVCRGCSLCA